MIELDRHIELLLLDNDCVIIPHFGGFMAHYVEARKDERDCAFLPPMRTIGFNPKLTLNDSLLAQSYVEVYDISYPDAIARIEDEVRELKQHLAHDEQYEMNSIGTLKLNKNGDYEFEPCSAGILTPSLYGLSYYEFKTLTQIEASETAKIVQLNPTEAQVAKHGTVDSMTAEENDTEEVQEETNSAFTTLWRNIAVACVAFIIFLLIPAPLANNNAQLIQSKVNTGLLDYIMLKDITMGEKQTEEAIKASQNDIRQVELKEQNAVGKTEERSGFTIVLASKVTKKNASAYVDKLHKASLNDSEVYTTKTSTRVVYGTYATQEEAYNTLNKLRKHREFEDAWVMKY
ncbi:sporulation and cell division repeat protein [Bacteroidales bacterium KA00344]|nr:sporulation and cell division repeat protein [Bacteroidales bacterium KA00344]